MKLLHVNDHYQLVGGAETVLFNWLEALEDQGVVNVVVHQHPSNVDESKHRRVYQVPNLGEIASRDRAAVAEKFREILQQEQPDLIHIHDIGNPDIAEVSLGFGPTIQSVFNHSFYCPGGSRYLPFLGRICERPFGAGCLVSAFVTHCNTVRPSVLLASYRRSYQMMRNVRGLVFLTLSRYQADCLIQSGCPRSVVKVLPPFTVLPKLDDQHEDSVPHKILLFTGRAFWQKGLDVLLESLRHLRSSFHLIVDGDGPDLGRARTLASQLGLENRVEFVGWTPREQHLAHYRKASVVIVPSVWPEPFGMVGIEAMSFAKPVVAFRMGGIPEWLENGVTGFLVEPHDAKGMAEKIDYLLENPNVAKEMGKAGRERVELSFSRDNHMTRLLEIYQQVISDRTRV